MADLEPFFKEEMQAIMKDLESSDKDLALVRVRLQEVKRLKERLTRFVKEKPYYKKKYEDALASIKG